MISFTLVHPRANPEMLGLLSSFWSEHDPRSAAEQANSSYAHGGGWQPFSGFTVTPKGLKYAGDPPMLLIAEAKLRNETIRLYECSWVSITQSDGSVEISRMD